MKSFSMTIDGQLVETNLRFNVVNPATEEVVGNVPVGNASNVDDAVAAAAKAFPAWSSLSDEARSETLNELACLLESNMQELMELVTLETGKPLTGLGGVGSAMEIGGAIAWTRTTAALSLPVDIIQDDETARVEVHRKPLGVVGSITPWNWPLMIAIWHVMPAIRTGNTVIVKPSELAPLATARFVELANQILPKGVLNLVTGPAGSDVGPSIVRHPGVSKVVFTGSTATGKAIMEAASSNLKRLTLELGGNDAGIILPGTDIQKIAPQIFAAAFHNNGQTCACLKRIYVHEDDHDLLCDALKAMAERVIVGDGMNPQTQLGPVQNAMQLAKIESIVAEARERGGRFLCGGRRKDGPGYFYEPTIVTDLNDGARLIVEEPFGPVVPLVKYKDINQAIEMANNSESGLGGSIWADDASEAVKYASRLECGTVWVNEHGAIQPNAPFGGIKQSGFGVEFGTYGLEEYTSIQTVKVSK